MRNRTSITLGLLGAIVLATVMAMTWTASNASTELDLTSNRQDDGRAVFGSTQATFDIPVKKDSVLSWPLVQLADAQDQASQSGQDIDAAHSDILPKSLRDFVTAGLMHITSAGDVQVFLHTTESSAASVAPVLKSLGARIEIVASEHDIIQARVPIGVLRTVARTDGVRQVRLPDYGVTQAGSVTTEGDSLLNAAEARSTFGIDGSGVRVGVISDGVAGLAASQASGDLPAVDTTTCNVWRRPGSAHPLGRTSPRRNGHAGNRSRSSSGR